MPDQGPCFYCNAPATPRPNKPTVCQNCHDGIQKEKDNVFNPEDITKARSETLPPCVECNSIHTLAIRRNDIRYAVTACIECQHRRPLTEAEYLAKWPDVPECEHEEVNMLTNQCKRCFMQFIICTACTLAAGSGLPVHHTAPPCPQDSPE